MNQLESHHDRTLIRITNVRPNNIADAVLPGWNSKEVIQIDLTSSPEAVQKAIREKISNGAIRTFVYANLRAQTSEELQLKDLELPPEDPPEDFLT